MKKVKQYGTLCMGPEVTIYGPFFAIYYEPTAEQIENFKKFFGWTYLTNEEFEEFERKAFSNDPGL